ncbi:polymorphic toxin-type HINT domain-containing protein [Streptomyces sp. NPDC049040]|uniref:polymorphic toxin-type HINT domain-containing protein n=1 Tax=Streptomyces sp. NPDC049040 TaxID=3365593 RepID=UPI00371847EE
MNDAISCFTEGNVMGCINTALGSVPWTKVFKAFKVGVKAFKVWREVEKAESLVKDTQEAVNVAEDVLAAKREAASAAAMNDADAAADAAAKEAPSPAPSCSVHSFLADTPVSLAGGETKAISQFKAGDTVQATDPQTGVTRPEKVLKVIVTHTDQDFTDLTLTTDDARPNAPPAHLTTTWHHPFWDATHHRWTDAQSLTPGTHLRQPDGTTVTVATVRNYHRQAVTYDLTVADLHSYYVLAGATPVLVHNCGGSNVGGTHGSLKPANQPGFNGPQEINHMPQDASTGSAISYGKGPAIRMEKADHRQVWSTGQGSRAEPKAWRMMQTDLVNSGRIDAAMMNDINDVLTRFPGKYNNAIGDMIGGLSGNAQYQALRGVPQQVHVQLTLW